MVKVKKWAFDSTHPTLCANCPHRAYNGNYNTLSYQTAVDGDWIEPGVVYDSRDPASLDEIYNIIKIPTS
jgi:hypothetical protein